MGNKYQYNDIELEDALGINIAMEHYRTLDPQLGRWWQIDPKPLYSSSNYTAMVGNPIVGIDPLGDTTHVYGKNGVFIKSFYGKSSAEIHYVDAYSKSASEADIRKNSIAYIKREEVNKLLKIAKISKHEKLERLIILYQSAYGSKELFPFC